MNKEFNVMLLVDGDRRWAKKRGLPFHEGYAAMTEKIAFCCEYLSGKGVTTLYMPVCSIHNLSRPRHEVDSFLDAFLAVPDRFTVPVTLSVAGNLAALPGDYPQRYADLPSRGEPDGVIELVIMPAWSAEDEMVRIYNRLHPTYAEIDTKILTAESDVKRPLHLWIRTGMAQRLSSMVAITSPYTELYFLDILFPDIDAAHLDEALEFYGQREARHGL
jgi:undecaprenyl diphosphate synthase